MSKEKKTKEELTKEVTEQLAQLNEREQLEGLIKDNKIEFEVDGKKYRVRKPTQGERLAVQKARNKKYIELLKDDSYMLKEQLVEIYKKKGIDIEERELKIKDLTYEIEDIQVKLDNTVNKDSIKVLKKAIDDKRQEQSKISIGISELLEACIEVELLEFGNLYLIYTILEKFYDGKVIEGDSNWIKCFKNYEEFLATENEELVLQAVCNLSLLIYKQDMK